MLNMFRCGAAVAASINIQQRTALHAGNPTAFRTPQSQSPSPPHSHQLFPTIQDTLKVMNLDAFKALSIITYFVLGHRVCANPLSALRPVAQRPATKDTSIPLSSTPLSSSPNLHLPSRHIAIDNSGQGVIPTLGHPVTCPTSDLPESPWRKLVVLFQSRASLTIKSRMGDIRTPVCQVPEP